MMKTSTVMIIGLLAGTLAVIGCTDDPPADGTGGTWDTADDVTEEEAQDFTWTLVNAELTHIHILEIGGHVPKVYTVTELTSSTLTYNDDFGVEFSFTKVSI